MKTVLLFAVLALVGCSVTTYKVLEHPETNLFRKECDFSRPLSNDFKIGDVVVSPSTSMEYPNKDTFRLIIGFSAETNPSSIIEVSDVTLTFFTDGKSYSLTSDKITTAEFKKLWSGYKSDVNYYHAAVAPFKKQAFKPVNKNSTIELDFTAELKGAMSLRKTFKYRLQYKELKYSSIDP